MDMKEEHEILSQNGYGAFCFFKIIDVVLCWNVIDACNGYVPKMQLYLCGLSF